ncbi:MAG: flagellar M-ring protein FliF, partial [Desulfatitalea sp.]|nr:flagellar M-ring protein FliF [Desulfatitalea sp.]NNK00685.1 flagellar M-ring protein FliF [Desulfatitalea sp.]
VSSSVSRLKPEDVTVVDQNGKMLAGMNHESALSTLSATHLEFQHTKERMLERRVLSMLEKVLGHDKAIVRVACDLDFIQQEQTEEKYLPQNQVVRSEQLVSEVSTQSEPGPRGVPGLAGNIDPTQRSRTTQTQSANGFQKEDKTRNYEIGKTTSRKILPVGKLQRLSVAVVVDGTYQTVTVKKGKQTHEETQYVSRSQEEIATLENIIKSAVNFDANRGDKVEVANIPFNTDPLMAEADGGGQWMEKLKSISGVVKYMAVAVFIFFTFIFVIRPLITWLTDTDWEDVDLFEQLPRTLSELEREYAARAEQESYIQQAAKLIESNKEDSSQLMQQWLKET